MFSRLSRATAFPKFGHVQRGFALRSFSSARPVYGLNEDFMSASQRVKTAGKKPDNNTLLRLYALFKQGSEGTCNAPKPSAMNFVAKAKWSAWNDLGNKSKEEAQKEYIALVDQLVGNANEASAKESTPKSEAPSGDVVLIEVQNKVMTITLNRPKKFNALNLESYEGIITALNNAKERDDVVAAMITGAGGYYSSGNDLSNFSNIPPEGPEKMAADATLLLERFVGTFIDFPKPLVAAVNGPAIGITVTTLALCDIVYCSDNATFATPFMSLGQSPEGCASLLFPQIMGVSLANEMLLTGKKMTSSEAKACGFVAEVFPTEQFRSIVNKRVADIAALPPKSLQYGKQLVRDPQRELLHKVNKAECLRLQERWLSEECFEAITKFMSRK